MKKFEIGKRADIDLFNNWLRTCEEKQIPYIIIRNSYKYSKISWDYISFQAQKKDNLFLFSNNETVLLEKFISLFNKYANKKSKYEISGLLVTYKNILIEDSNKMAEELFDIIESIFE